MKVLERPIIICIAFNREFRVSILFWILIKIRLHFIKKRAFDELRMAKSPIIYLLLFVML